MTTPTQTFNVGSQAALNSAIETIDQDGSGNFTINLTGDISVSPDGDPQGLYAIDTGATVTINGNGFTLQGTGQAAVDGGSTDTGLAVLAGKVTIQNLTIEDTNAKGGDGSGSGGGGAGLGGGLFVGSNASVTLDDVNFQKDQAQGGNGGSGVGGGGAGGNASILVPNLGGAGPDGADGEDGDDGEQGANGAGAPGGPGGTGAAGSIGGAGGFGGDGGAGGAGGAGGHGGAGGAGADGPEGLVKIGSFAYLYTYTGAGGNGGDGGDAGDGGDGGDGGAGGIGAVGGDGGDGGDGGEEGDRGQGGAGAPPGNEGAPGDNGAGGNGGNGGTGGYGGGGGAGGNGGPGGNGGGGYISGLNDTGGGGNGGNGGNAGFGGGGGGGGAGGSGFSGGGAGGGGGEGGFGGGGGGGGPGGYNSSAGQYGTAGGGNVSGFGAGDGAGASQGGGGGGGLGAGGDIFVASGGSLIIEGGLVSGGSTLDSNGGAGAIGGAALGNGIFLQGGNITLSATSANPLVVNDPITDQKRRGRHSVAGLNIAGTGTVELASQNAFGGGIDIKSGTLELAATGAAGSGPIKFDPGTLEFAPADAPSNPIENFGAGDKIIIDDFQETGASYSGGHLVLDGPGGPASLDLPGFTSVSQFNIVADATTDATTITTNPCYCRGTLIQTERGQRRVEQLEIGEEVITASGRSRPIKWIGRRNYASRFVMGPKNILPICIKAGTLDDNVPKRDLWISPNHALFFKDEHGGVLVEAKDLVNGVSIVQAESVQTIEYFHIELETHDIIFAEGALSKSFIDDDSRGMFHNAHEYRLLYPAAAETTVARYCAPRLDEGYELETIRQRIALRAGLATNKEAAAGALRGFVDQVAPHLIEGWAQNVDHPEAPVCLDIFAGGLLIGQVLANCYREDLKRAGIGNGFHSFRFTPPDGIALVPDAVEVRRSLDQAVLPLSSQARSIGTSAAA